MSRLVPHAAHRQLFKHFVERMTDTAIVSRLHFTNQVIMEDGFRSRLNLKFVPGLASKRFKTLRSYMFEFVLRFVVTLGTTSVVIVTRSPRQQSDQYEHFNRKHINILTRCKAIKSYIIAGVNVTRLATQGGFVSGGVGEVASSECSMQTGAPGQLPLYLDKRTRELARKTRQIHIYISIKLALVHRRNNRA